MPRARPARHPPAEVQFNNLKKRSLDMHENFSKVQSLANKQQDKLQEAQYDSAMTEQATFNTCVADGISIHHTSAVHDSSTSRVAVSTYL